MAHPEIEAEQAYITRAHWLLEKSRERALKLRSMVEVGRGGTRQALFERDVIEEQIANRRLQLNLGPSSLIFGRIDHAQELGTEANSHNQNSASEPSGEPPNNTSNNTGSEPAKPGPVFYIGRVAVSDEDYEPVVVDWRAPIAEPFFRASSTDPMGLVRRRHFVTRGSELLDIEDELFELDLFFEADHSASHPTDQLNQPSNPLGLRAHGALYAALEERRSGHMRDVVATIQADQDEIIRCPQKGILIVQGGPGTGKTVVALHRAAYLLYTNRFPLTDQGLLVIGPNRLFLRYIERVLPSLGEVGAHLYVLADLFNDLFADVRVTQADGPEETAIKGSARMAEVLANAIALRQRPLRTRLRVPFRASYLTLTPQQSRHIIAEARRRFSTHNAARRFVENSVFATLASSQPRWEEADLTDSQTDTDQTADPTSEADNASSLTATERRRSRMAPHLQEAAPAELIQERLSEHPDVVEALERMWPTLSPAQMLRDLFGSPALLAASSKGLLNADEQTWLQRPRGDDLAGYAWSDADVPLLDEAYELLGARHHNERRSAIDPEVRTFGHIVVDEAQDHSPMSLRMIARRSLNGSMTLVGDIAQATSPSAVADWEEIVAALSDPKAGEADALQRRELTLSYRIPRPSLEPANAVLAVSQPDVSPAIPVRDIGPEPEFITTDDTALLTTTVKTVDRLSQEGMTVLVVAPPSLIDELETAMTQAELEFGRATASSRNATGTLHPNVTLATVELIKGLETDAVLVLEPDDIVQEEPRGLGALYVALTRATRQIAVVHAAPLPEPLVSYEHST